ncbi:DedA family protein [Falsibacillus pallidus]|uniref:DedA family protein n=1 Tax=Falsibacillus pallidus TaxID=493781 RepID=UPI0024821551|nr:VTT domain-containing protein [Falsibacillus pallidus]
MERSGSKLLVFAYFIPGVRHITGYVSGISRMRNRTFFIPAYIGVWIWGTCFISIGKVLGPQWDRFHHVISHYISEALIVGIVVAAVYFIFRFYKRKITVFLSIALLGIAITLLVIFQTV